MKLRPSLIFMPAGDQTGKNLEALKGKYIRKKHKYIYINTKMHSQIQIQILFFMMKVHQSGKKLRGAQEKIQRAASLSRYS